MTLVLVCGSRTWTDRDAIHRRLSQLEEGSTVITGTRPKNPVKGADQIACDVAIDLGLNLRVIEAEWGKFGRSAGPIRNRQMLDMNPSLVLAFWDGKSRGTMDTVKEAWRRGVPVEMHE